MIYKDTVHWHLYICIVTLWPLLQWMQNSCPVFIASYSTNQKSMNIVLRYDAFWTHTWCRHTYKSDLPIANNLIALIILSCKLTFWWHLTGWNSTLIPGCVFLCHFKLVWIWWSNFGKKYLLFLIDQNNFRIHCKLIVLK